MKKKKPDRFRDRRAGRSLKDDDSVYVVCLPVTTSDGIIPGSLQQNCAFCSEPIWVSPGTRASFTAEQHPQYICMDCALKEKDFTSALQPPTPKQVEELRRYLEDREKEEKP